MPNLQQVRSAVSGEIKEARLKEFKGKLKQLVQERDSAQDIVDGKEAEIEALADKYSDVLSDDAPQR